MKPDALYENLKQLAEKLEIRVSEENLKRSGFIVKSGFCTVRGNKLFIMDKTLKLHQKTEILAEFLSSIPLEEIYVVPAVRELLDRYAKRTAKNENDGAGGDSASMDVAPS